VEKKTKASVAETAYGEKLAQPIAYEYSWEVYENPEELKAANDQLTLAEQVKVRAAEAQANARQKALTAALEAAGIVKPTAENNEQVRLRDTYKMLMTAKLADGSPKYTPEQAREVASTVIGADWAE
jgi:hypothetical protein